MYIVWAVAGLSLFGLIASGGQIFLGLALGAMLGLMWARLSSVSRDLKKTREQLDELIAHRVSAPVVAPRPVIAPSNAPPIPAAPPTVAVAPVDEAVRSTPSPVRAVSERASPLARISTAAPPFEPPKPGFVELAMARFKGWFTEGNVPVKIGMLVLFAGVAALLKYASDTGLLNLPIGLRVALVALAAIAALAFGWRQRDMRRVFALSLQGGAIGVLLITVFAAFRLYGLLQPMAAFGLLIVLVAGVGMLAILQDALALAVLGLIAGFAAPILVSTGSGSQVALFSYYALLNLAILGIAWKRSWRVLNLLGFVATFGIGTAWGVLKYQPALFAGTEPFLILNFFFYLVIPLLYLLRAPADRGRVIDGCLLFGNPLISLLLQAALLRWHGQPLAISALAAAVIYLAVAWRIRDRVGLGLLRDAWAVMAVAFATLAVPLALSASLTSSVFALEGAGLIWLGLRQQRWLSRWSGIALQLFAAIALVISVADSFSIGFGPWLDRGFVGLLLLAAGAFASSGFYVRLGSSNTPQKLASVLLYAWGLCCWLGASGVEIHRYLTINTGVAASTLLFALTGWVVAELARRIEQHVLGRALAFTASLMFLFMLPLQFFWSSWNLLAVLVSAVLGWRTLRCLRDRPRAVLLTQWLWCWRWMLLVVFALRVLLVPKLQLSDSWAMLLTAAPMCIVLWLSLTRPLWIARPLPQYWPQLRAPLQYSVLIVLGIIWAGALFMDGDVSPLRYLPILNPIELLLLMVLFCVARWMGDAATPPVLRQRRPIVLGLLFMAFATSVTLRAVHQLAGVPWDDALGDSSLAQMSLTVVWSALGLLAWVWGSRRGQRVVWLAGAVTMAVVLAKLLLIDRSHLGNLFGIGSFIAYGLLCTVIGYLAPAPPKRADPTPLETADAS